MKAQGPTTAVCDGIRACVVIPVFNNVRTVADVVRGALEHASTVLVLDDGSSDGSGAAAEAAGAVLLRHAVNAGKGAALRDLLAEASRRGFACAISMDADGQHLPSDLPKLAAAAAREPGTLIIGVRDLVAAGAPPSSEFGRKFSNFWIWLETGMPIDDSQSGFRAYPLPESTQVGAGYTRYEFEANILLRLAWAGVPRASVPIEVIYPPDRVTHFRLVLDNVRIVLVNVLACLRQPLPFPLAPALVRHPHRPGLSLFALRRWAWLGGAGLVSRGLAALAGLGALLAFPAPELRAASVAGAFAGVGAFPILLAAQAFRLLRSHGVLPGIAAGLVGATFVAWGLVERLRRPRARGPERWTGRSRGSVHGYRFGYWLTGLVGVHVAYVVLYPVTLYFVLVVGPARRASMEYLARAIGPSGPVRRLLRTYWHLLVFSRTMVDRALLATRGRPAFEIEQDGLEHIRTAAAQGTGALLLTAHLGNWDVAAGLLGQGVASKVTIVAFPGEQARIARFLAKTHAQGPRVIEVGEGRLASLEMVRALRDGQLLAFQGDRPIDSNVVRIPFLGREAPFPLGPFMLAAVSGAPVIATFSLQLGPAKYRFFALPPIHVKFAPGKGRTEQLRGWVELYVRELEAIVRAHPYQWFNFYDFWDAPPPALPGAAAGPVPEA